MVFTETATLMVGRDCIATLSFFSKLSFFRSTNLFRALEILDRMDVAATAASAATTLATAPSRARELTRGSGSGRIEVANIVGFRRREVWVTAPKQPWCEKSSN